MLRDFYEAVGIPEPTQEEVDDKRRPLEHRSSLGPVEPALIIWQSSRDLCFDALRTRDLMASRGNNAESMIQKIAAGLTPDESSLFWGQINGRGGSVSKVRCAFGWAISAIIDREQGPAIDECDEQIGYLQTLRDICIKGETRDEIRDAIKRVPAINGLDTAQLMMRIYEFPHFDKENIIKYVEHFMQKIGEMRQKLIDARPISEAA